MIHSLSYRTHFIEREMTIGEHLVTKVLTSRILTGNANRLPFTSLPKNIVSIFTIIGKHLYAFFYRDEALL